MSTPTDKIAYKDLVERYRKIFNEYYDLLRKHQKDWQVLDKVLKGLEDVEDELIMSDCGSNTWDDIIKELKQHINKQQEE